MSVRNVLLLLVASTLLSACEPILPDQPLDVADGGGLSGNGTASDPLRFTGALVPPGTIVAFAGQIAPVGWVLCDGRSLTATDQAFRSLFSVIGFNYGGNMTNAFNVPDLAGRIAIGVGTHKDVGALALNEGAQAADRTPFHQHGASHLVVESAGSEHSHGLNNGAVGVSGNAFLFAKGTDYGFSTLGGTAVGGTHSHKLNGTVGDHGGPLDTPPFLTVNYIIKL